MVKQRMVLLLLSLTAVLVVACGGDGGQGTPIVRSPSPSPSPSPAGATPEPTPEPTEFRVAYLDLMSPLSTDETNTIPGDTHDARLTAIIEELTEFKPDMVGFSEATRTSDYGDTIERLATELKMQPQSVHVNPGFPGQTETEMKQLSDEIGWQENELILVRSDRFPDLGASYKWLNPRTSDTEARRALHVKVKGPGELGAIDLFITHLTGGGPDVRTLQAQTFASFITQQRTDAPVVVVANLNEGPESEAYQSLRDIGLHDPFEDSDVLTCCRQSVLGEQAPFTDRTDYVLTWGWSPTEIGTFGNNPSTLGDGTAVYPSDHLGLWAVFSLEALNVQQPIE
jgi:endonuclease/exonuclease/phosphatase family metal-dependent hydrolase